MPIVRDLCEWINNGQSKLEIGRVLKVAQFCIKLGIEIIIKTTPIYFRSLFTIDLAYVK